MRKLIVMVVLLGGCTMPSLSPYRIDVQQGNYVTQEMVSKLKPGMTRAQVRYTLGAPLIVDPFHSDRWDYVYLYQKAGKVTEQRRIVVIFVDDKLARVEGDVVPQTAPPPGAADKPVAKPSTVAPAPPAAGTAKPDAGAVPQPEGVAAGGGSAPPAGASPGGAARQAETKSAPSEPAKSETSDEKPKEEKGFFGRMLEKLGL